MRLRQAHAMLEVAAALEATGLGFKMWPFDHDHPDAIQPVTDDYMTGFAEFNDPDHPDDQTRIYHVTLKPWISSEIVASVTYGYPGDPDGALIFRGPFPVRGDDPEHFQVGLGARIADMIVSAVREHEKPHEAAYAARTGGAQSTP